MESAERRHQRVADEARRDRRWDVAAVHYRRLLELQPDWSPIWVQLGHMLKESGQVAASLEAYRRALVLTPDDADAHLQLGHALKLQGRVLDAVGSYARALELDPTLEHAAAELRALDAYPVKPGATGSAAPSERSAADDLAEILARFGLLPHVLRSFDSEFYLAAQHLKPAPGDDHRVTALQHFGSTGVAGLAAISERLWFDPAFHTRQYGNPYGLSDADAYRHWLNLGIPLGQAPNMTAWMQDVAGIDLPDPAQIDLGFFRAGAPETESMSDTAVIQWLVAGSLLDHRLDGPSTRNRLALTEAAAKRASLRGDLALSLALMQRVLAEKPLHPSMLQLYADRLTDSGQYFQAGLIYKQVIDAGLANRWTHTHYFVCLRHQRRFQDAFHAMAAGAARFPQYPTLRDNRREVTDDYFHATVRQYEVLARAGRIEDGQELVTAFCKDVTAPRTAERLPARPVRAVALFSLTDLPQCRFYRVDQKVEQLEAAGLDVTMYDSNTGLKDFLAEIRRFQAVIFYRLSPLPHVIEAMEAARAMGLITFYEIDDLLFLASEYPGPLEGYAGQITRDTYTMLAMGVPLFLSAMRMCDYALASTPTLAREMAPFVRTGRAFVHRNGMGSDHERYLDFVPPARRPGQPVTIFYGSGTRAHKEDFQLLIEPALVEIARTHGAGVSFIMIGWLPISDAFRDAAGERLMVIEPVFDLHEYWQLLRQGDINVAVLKPSLNVDAKSEIKWMEAAMFGIPSVVSRTATYEEVIEDGRTGFLCDTVADWVRVLDRLVRDAELRRSVGLAAQEVVRSAYPIKALAANIASIMAEVSPPEPPPRQRVLVVNVFYAPQLYGGATRVVHDNIAYLSRARSDDFEFSVFCCRDEAREDYVVESHASEGIPVTSVSRSVAGEESGELFDKRMGEIFRDHLDTIKPDLVHFHCIQRLTLAVVEATRDKGIPYVITAHDAWWISDNQFLLDAAGRETTYQFDHPRRVLSEQGRHAFNRMQSIRPALEGARAVLGVSEPFSQLYRRCGVPNVRTVANGASALSPAPRTRSRDGRVRLGHVGGMTRHKGFALLKQVLTENEFGNLRLIAVDRGKERGHVHEERWGSTEVTVLGDHRQDEVTQLYAEIDVLAAPSLWTESYGLVTREALLCGCWVVASDRGAIGTDVVDGVNGFVVDVSDHAGLTEALRRIDRDHERFLSSPPPSGIRRATEQGDELAALYREVRTP